MQGTHLILCFSLMLFATSVNAPWWGRRSSGRVAPKESKHRAEYVEHFTLNPLLEHAPTATHHKPQATPQHATQDDHIAVINKLLRVQRKLTPEEHEQWRENIKKVQSPLVPHFGTFSQAGRNAKRSFLAAKIKWSKGSASDADLASHFHLRARELEDALVVTRAKLSPTELAKKKRELDLYENFKRLEFLKAATVYRKMPIRTPKQQKTLDQIEDRIRIFEADIASKRAEARNKQPATLEDLK